MTQSTNQRGHLNLIDFADSAAADVMRQVIEHAVKLKASDLFIVTNEQHVAVLVRYLGVIEPLAILDADQGHRCIAHLRAEAGMDLLDHRRPQDGRFIYKLDEGEPVDLRISIMPTLYGGDMAIRLLVRDSSLLSIDRIGMTPQQQEIYRAMLERPGGLILLTGPTGSGKTVTLYASLTHLNDGSRKINTIEDPIEYAVDGLRQSQVNLAVELGPAELLRGVLRQSCDVIMIGEIRDTPTAEAAVWAANSGVMVLATVHAPSAVGAIQSMRGFGISAAFLANSLRGVVNVRLLRTLCADCREVTAEGDAAKQQFKDIETHLAPGQGNQVYASRGCGNCHHTGFTGRVGAFELLPVTESLRNLIMRNRSAKRIRAQAIDEGLITLRQAALLESAQGLTPMDEVRRVIPGPLPGPKRVGQASASAAALETAGVKDGDAIVWR